MSIAVAYLGPPGTYSHLVAEKRFGQTAEFLPLPTILDVCRTVARRPGLRGVIPIENSSGGAVHETIDILLAGRPHLCITEELSLHVRLALMGRKSEKIKVLYSHFAPLEHCATWIRRHLPRVEKRTVASTAVAARQASEEPGAAALGSRRLARLYGLKVLHYPVEADVPNLTTFLAIGGTRRIRPGSTKTTLAVKLPNIPGSLCTFLEAFRDGQVNLSRLISRPIRGCPKEYAFLVDIDGPAYAAAVKQALAQARKSAVQIRVAGSYPSRHPYQS